MDLRTLLESIYKKEITVDEAMTQISLFPIENILDGIARLDISREMRKGVPEVIFAERKDHDDIVEIALRFIEKNGHVLISRIDKSILQNLINVFDKYNLKIEQGKKGNTLLISQKSHSFLEIGTIGIICAGTSDIGIAEESRLISKSMGCKALTFYDVGIAGFQRILPVIEIMLKQRVSSIVVVAGMEGALASVVSSLVDVPVIGVPTSIGYGFGANGYASLASMLQSCSFGLAVVNIDNGIGAGALASLIAKRSR